MKRYIVIALYRIAIYLSIGDFEKSINRNWQGENEILLAEGQQDLVLTNLQISVLRYLSRPSPSCFLA